ncbi:MAG: penicillin-binding protein 1B [Endozoicomonas sp.]
MAKKTTTKKTRSSMKKRQCPPKSWCPILLKLCFTLTAILIAYAAYLDAVVTRQFEGKKWAIPAKVFARPLELYVGKRIASTDLQSQLERQGYQAVQKVNRPGTFARSGSRFVIYSRGFYFPDGAEPSRYTSVHIQDNEVISLTSNDKNLPLLRMDPQPIGGIYPASYEDRLLIRSSQTPRYLIPSLLTIEDRDYYEHLGLSPMSIARAMVANLRAGSVVQGGSTITQQLVKNFFLTNERTLIRKGKEAIMALLLEFHYNKEEILEAYLNEVYLGQHGRRAIHGFGLASQFYFAQPIQELNLARTALLVAIVKGPSYFDPRRYPGRALERRNLVLDVMAERSIVSQEEVERSKKLPLGVVSRELVSTNDFPAYIDMVKEQLRKEYDEKDLTSEGLRIFTNLDPIIQREAQKSVSTTLNSLGKENRLQGAMVISSAQTGDLLAVVGDRNSGYAGFNRAVEARRPVGSLLKPAIYLTALEHPEQFTLTTMVNDTAVKIKDGRGGYWEPKNYSRESHGQVPLYLALAKSYNQAAANTGMAVGLPSVKETLKRLGVEQPVPSYPSVLLGSLSMTPIEVASMYQTIASGGFRMPIRAIDAVVDSQGQALTRYSISVERAFNPAPMELLRTALGIVMSEGTGRRVYQYIKADIPLGGKTGTTNDHRDSWFAGYSGDLVVVSWIGHDDNSPTKLTGSSGALKIWGNFIANVPIQPVVRLQANNLTRLWVNPVTNRRSHQYCEGAIKLPYITGSEPKSYIGCGKDNDDSLFDRIKAWF